ncbi:MAG: flagellar biosynthesis protein FlhF [Planctomycetes bacterium]|nr:flagellar biosynthesis protein FlhF [Planctomycetota bacterium]
MNAKTYRAATLALALAEVKKDLGARAVIVRTRTIREGGVFGIFAKDAVEITASADLPEAPAHTIDLDAAEPKAITLDRLTTRVEPNPVDDRAAAAIREDLAAVKRLVGRLRSVARIPGAGASALDHTGDTDTMFALLLRMREARIPAPAIDEVLSGVRIALPKEQLDDATAVGRSAIAALAGMIPCVGELSPPVRSGDRPFTVALMGPTGVGKTTTLAKLAATYAVQRGAAVGMLACDAYRIGAVEQLRAYAQIMGLEFAVAETADQVPAALETLNRCDVVLMDTAGRSQTDGKRLAETASFLGAAEPHETHLVISAAGDEPTSCRVIDAFGALRPDRLILTKLDEAASPGHMLALIRRAAMPVSYVSCGQEVPEDFRVATGESLAGYLLDGMEAIKNPTPAAQGAVS